MKTGHPLGDLMLELLSPSPCGRHLVFADDALATLRSAFLKAAHGAEPEHAGRVVLTGVGFLSQHGQKEASRQLLGLLVEVVESLEEPANAERFEAFLGQARAVLASGPPPRGSVRAGALLSARRMRG